MIIVDSFRNIAVKQNAETSKRRYKIMAVLENLEPKSVFSFFEQLCAIPHGSHNTKLVSDWLKDFAEKQKLKK